jgi:hypothetical protein
MFASLGGSRPAGEYYVRVSSLIGPISSVLRKGLRCTDIGCARDRAVSGQLCVDRGLVVTSSSRLLSGRGVIPLDRKVLAAAEPVQRQSGDGADEG